MSPFDIVKYMSRSIQHGRGGCVVLTTIIEFLLYFIGRSRVFMRERVKFMMTKHYVRPDKSNLENSFRLNRFVSSNSHLWMDK